MKCLQCGGNVTSITDLVCRNDSGSSGSYQCQECGRVKKWSIPGHEEIVMDMDDSDDVHNTKEDKE